MAGTKVGVTVLCAMLCVTVAHAQEFCGESVPVKGAPRPMPSRGYVTCCNPQILLQTRTNLSTTMVDTLKAYLRRGGRLIDTAEAYMVESSVGIAVRDSGVPRNEIWISSKVNMFTWSASLGDPTAWVLAQVDKSLQAMGLSYIDVMQLHMGPMQLELTPGTVISTEVFLGMWRGLIEAKRLGKILYLGVCEMRQAEIEQLMRIEPPQVALLWLNPWMPDGQLAFAKWLKDSGIAVIAYGLFNFKLLPLSVNRKVKAAMRAAERHGVTWGQFMIQWALQQGYAFITGMYHEEYLAEDAVCLNFTVTSHDMAILDKQPKFPCKFGEKCVGQYFPGCFPPGSKPYHHTFNPIMDVFACRALGPHLSEELPHGHFHIFGQELILDIPMLIVMLLATATAIWHFSKRGVATEEGLSVALLE